MISELYLFSFFTEGVRQRLYLIQKREHRCEYLSGRDIEASSDVTQLIAVKRQLLITVPLKIKGTTLYLSVPIFKRERIKIQLSEFNFYSVNSKNILSISSYLYC